MNIFADLLEPADKYVSGLINGSYTMNQAANRVVDPQTGRFVAHLIPSRGVSEAASQLPPFQPELAAQMITRSDILAPLAPALQALQITTSIAALASVANLGVSCVGFALVLQRLNRIDGKLDKMLHEIDILKSAVNATRGHQEALSLARLNSAAESLQRAIMADSESVRMDLASRARGLFQETRHLYLALWTQAQPWQQVDIPILTVLEIHARIVACGIGELNAELAIGDLGAYSKAVEDIAQSLSATTCFVPAEAFRKRSDMSVQEGKPTSMGSFQLFSTELVKQLQSAYEVTEFTLQRLRAFSNEVELTQISGLEPYQFMREVQNLSGSDLYMLPLSKRNKKKDKTPWYKYTGHRFQRSAQ